MISEAKKYTAVDVQPSGSVAAARSKCSVVLDRAKRAVTEGLRQLRMGDRRMTESEITKSADEVMRNTAQAITDEAIAAVLDERARLRVAHAKH